MPLPFDDLSADQLIQDATSVAQVLRGQNTTRENAADAALQDFSGGYKNLFTQACLIEKEDRAKLAGTLDDLAISVREAKLSATQERNRIADLAAWQVRENERRQDVLGAGPLWNQAWGDPKPSVFPLRPASISATFSARERNRVSRGGDVNGTSSADPAKLQTFVTQTLGSNTALQTNLTTLRTAWFGFTSTCRWVPLGSINFLAGFSRLVEENQADSSWIEQVAAAFERAGGGEVSNFTVALVSAAGDPALLRSLLESKQLSVEDVAEIASYLVANPEFKDQTKRALAYLAANNIAECNIDAGTNALLDLFKDDQVFTHRLFNKVTPDEIGTAIQYMSGVSFPDQGQPPSEYVPQAEIYADFLAAAGHAFATFTKGTGRYAPPRDLSNQWSDAITDDVLVHNGAALTLFLKYGGQSTSFAPQFLSDVTTQVYEWERSFEGAAVWGPRHDQLGQYGGIKDPHLDFGDPGTTDDDFATYHLQFDGLANLLAATENTPETAELFFADAGTTTIEGTEVNQKLLYLLADRRWPTDDGAGFGTALVGATTHSRDAVSTENLSNDAPESQAATLASQTMFVIGNKSGEGDSWLPGDDGWHLSEGMTTSVGKILTSYMPDIYRASLQGGGESVTSGWTHSSDLGEGLTSQGMSINIDDLKTVLQDVGRYDDKTGMQILVAGALAHHGGDLEAAIADERMPNGGAPNSLQDLRNSDFGTNLEDLSVDSGNVLAVIMNKGFLGGNEGEAATQEQRDALAKAFGVATDFVPAVKNPIGQVLTSESLGLLEGQLAVQPESVTQQ